MQQVCSYRQNSACHSFDDPRVTVRPGGLPSVTLGFLLSEGNASQYHWAKWEERSRGTATLMRRAAARLGLARRRPLDVWVHVADAGFPELPLPLHPTGLTIETVASSRAAAASLFPDYSLTGWEAIGFGSREHGGSLASFVASLLRAGQLPPPAPLRPQAIFVGNEQMHPVRPQLRTLAKQWYKWLDVRHVPPYDADGARAFAPEHVPFARLAEWAVLLDVPGGGWSGRLKFLPLLQRPLLVLDRGMQIWSSNPNLAGGTDHLRSRVRGPSRDSGVGLGRRRAARAVRALPPRPYPDLRPESWTSSHASATATYTFRSHVGTGATISGGHVGQKYLLDTQDLYAQLVWCREQPHEAAAMVRRALLRTLETLSDEAVDAQAVHALQTAAQARGMLAAAAPFQIETQLPTTGKDELR